LACPAGENSRSPAPAHSARLAQAICRVMENVLVAVLGSVRAVRL
jgi:hypothetical protein